MPIPAVSNNIVAASVQVKLALEVHARQMGATLADIIKGVGSQSRRSLAEVSIGAPSHHFTASRRMSLLRAAGLSPQDIAPHAAAIESASNPGSPTGSHASSASNEAVVPVALLLDDEEEGNAEGGIVDFGSAPNMAPEAFTDAPLVPHTGVVRLMSLAPVFLSYFLHCCSPD
jgi:hypothetical protein